MNWSTMSIIINLKYAFMSQEIHSLWQIHNICVKQFNALVYFASVFKFEVKKKNEPM